MKKIKPNSRIKKPSKLGLLWELDPFQNKIYTVKEITDKFLFPKKKSTKKRPIHKLIEGENLYSLQYLQQEYLKKIDFIYIDPPYNTGFKKGQEGFIYHDHRSEKYHQYKHSAWLSFMYYRLILAKKLMSEDGKIFISIDEHEFAHLKLLCDELFGEENYLQCFIWKKRGTGGQVRDGSIITQTEFILAYAKNKNQVQLNKIPNPNAGNHKWRDFRKSGGQWQQIHRPKQHFPIYFHPQKNSLTLEKTNSNEIEILPQNTQGELGFWENGIDTTRERLLNNELKAVFNPKTNQYKILQLEEANSFQNAGNFLDIPSVKGSNEIKFFDLHFNNVKPTELIKYFLAIATHPHSIVLDFFAGSGSTAQAVMEWNHEHKQSQTVILCTSNEHEICENVTYPRLERIIKGYKNKNNKTYQALKQTLHFYKIEE